MLPSATEIVCALGFRAELVGRSHECDLPAGVEQPPALTEPKFAVENTRSRGATEAIRYLIESEAVLRRICS